MDIEKLIERLNTKLQSYALYTDSEFARAMEDAITAIETLRADLTRVTAERDGAIKDLNEFLSMDELCPIQCEWCKWNGTYCDGKTPEWRGVQNE